MAEHPVWHVYDELRTAVLNGHYYGAKLAEARRWHTVREFVMAASGSAGVGGLWFFSTEPGAVLWKLLTSLSACLAVYHTVTKPTERIRRLETHVTGWTQLEMSLSDIRRRIHELGRYDDMLQREVRGVLEGKRSIATDLVDTHVDEPLRERCYNQVKRELPPEVFFVPD